MDSEIKILLVKYISGQASAEEAKWLKAWIKETPANEEYYIELYEAWHNALIIKHEIDTDKAYADFTERTGQAGAAGAGAGSSGFNIGRLWKVIAAAASVVVCFSIALYYFAAGGEKESEFIVLNVSKGSREHVVLPDGSKVWVNAGSELRYQKDFGEISRTLYLNGEAYFDIAPSTKKIPFIVRTRDYVIRDIGTVFNIKAYTDMSVFEAAVLEGEISVEGKFNQDLKEPAKVFLKRRQVLKVDNREMTGGAGIGLSQERPPKAIAPLQIRQLNAAEEDQYVGWKDGLLAFNDASFGEIALDIERRYDVKIIFEDEDLKGYKYSGNFSSVNDIHTLFDIIKKTTPIDYSIRGKEISIKKDQLKLKMN